MTVCLICAKKEEEEEDMYLLPVQVMYLDK